jgi:hypothetical protein
MQLAAANSRNSIAEISHSFHNIFIVLYNFGKQHILRVYFKTRDVLYWWS